jgi:hypothetical protein
MEVGGCVDMVVAMEGVVAIKTNRMEEEAMGSVVEEPMSTVIMKCVAMTITMAMVATIRTDIEVVIKDYGLSVKCVAKMATLH